MYMDRRLDNDGHAADGRFNTITSGDSWVSLLVGLLIVVLMLAILLYFM